MRVEDVNHSALGPSNKVQKSPFAQRKKLEFQAREVGKIKQENKRRARVQLGSISESQGVPVVGHHPECFVHLGFIPETQQVLPAELLCHPMTWRVWISGLDGGRGGLSLHCPEESRCAYFLHSLGSSSLLFS